MLKFFVMCFNKELKCDDSGVFLSLFKSKIVWETASWDALEKIACC